jgi:hypothetical protein
VENPYKEMLVGKAAWLIDTSAFLVEPASIAVQIPAGGRQQYGFCLTSLKETMLLAALPQLEFNVTSEGRRHRFHREVRLVQETRTPFRTTARLLDGDLSNWEGIPVLWLDQAELRSCYDHEALCLAVSIPAFDAAEAMELGFTDQLQIGMSPSVSETDFGPDLLRLGLDSSSREARDRTPGHTSKLGVPGIKCISCERNGQNIYQIVIPLRLLKGLKPRPSKRILLDVSFLVPEPEANAQTPQPNVNSLSYRVRYGSDSLVPVYFVELNLSPERQD